METSQSSEKDYKMPWPAYAEVFELQQKLEKRGKLGTFVQNLQENYSYK